MKITADSPEAYIAQLPKERQKSIIRLRGTILSRLPQGFEETMSYGMIGYVVPHAIYPAGYHCDPKLPLPFINIAAQKHHIGFYHYGLYAGQALLQWLVETYPKHSRRKLDMGKCCIRFRNPDQIPDELIGELVNKISVKAWIEQYEQSRYARRKETSTKTSPSIESRPFRNDIR